ncbi:MAG: MGMT family protein [Rikenellaceae bacterium]|nr:MGMT family protein [Rikenellaceae bacterium]
MNFVELGKVPEKKIYVCLKGTSFRIAVWNELLKIPSGKFTTYGIIASRLGNPKASRGVGNAVGSNPVSILIPCHRVIRGDGNLGGYYWGIDLKKMVIGTEIDISE